MKKQQVLRLLREARESAMHDAGTLTRYRTGLQGMAGMGFPCWVYTYRLKEKAQ